ncbi:MAG: glycoside hydrolase family 127 protein [Planctomycetales bacterium]
MLRCASVLLVVLWSLAAKAEEYPSVRRVEPFPLAQVKLLDGPFREACLRNRAYLLSLDPDRLLHAFRLTAGLPTSAKPLGGWEALNVEVRGHTLGHYLSALALTSASLADDELKRRADSLVAELAKCQAALPAKGAHPGFLAAFPEEFFDRLEARKPVQVPWYTIHKIMAGLLDVHQQCGNAQALEVVRGMADWVASRVDRLSPEKMQQILEVEHGGMNEVLANLAAITHDPKHLRLAEAFNHRRIVDPLAQGVDALNGLHANTQIPKIVGTAREYELTGLQRYRDLSEFFWERVALHRSYAIGGHSDREHFFPVDQFAGHLSAETTETCNTYNMLKLTRHLFAWEPSARVMDFYERALYNHILASQDPRTGMFVYLTSLKPGHFKTYSKPEDSFWCCVGTGMENHAKYGDTIYARGADSLYVNLFIPSEVTWTEKQLTLRQDTTFPDSDITRLTVTTAQPQELSILVRSPGWTPSGAIFTLNGQPLEIRGTPGSYVTIRRRWQTGDRLEVQLPMTLRAEPLPYAPKTLAFVYGPIVLAGQLGTKDLPSPYATSQVDQIGLPDPHAPVFVSGDGKILDRIEKVPNQTLTFRTRGLGQPQDVTLIPFFRTHHQRYSVYWSLYSPQEWERHQAELAAVEARRREIEARRIDEVHPGEQQSETDHHLQGMNTQAGPFQDRKWRHAAEGWFSWDLKVAPSDVPQVLTCTYWGSDTGRTFDILVDGQKIATQTLSMKRPEEFIDVDYPLPPELLRNKQKVTIRFRPTRGGMAGGVFGCGVYRAKP